MRQDRPVSDPSDESGSLTTPLKVIVALLVVGAAWLLAGLLVPLFLAMTLAIAIAPVATRLERFGLPKTLASFLCLLALAGMLAGTAGLVLFQAGNVLRDSDRYVTRFSQILAALSEKTGGDQMMESLEVIDSEGASRKPANSGGEAPDPASGRNGPEETTQPKKEAESPKAARAGADGTTGSAAETEGVEQWTRLLHRGLRQSGRWVASGLGGLIGVVGGVVVFLAYFFYLLETRDEWIDRMTAALRRLGLHPTPDELAKVQSEIVAYFGCVSIVALTYVIVVSLVLWAIGVPQFLLWGLMAGLMEFVPYFGPLIASVAPTIVALSLENWWQPALVALLFLVLNFLESYVVAPLFYGKTIRFNPVTVLFGALFFGWIWGPLGLALAIPIMIILRSLLTITPDTPTLDALADLEEPKDADHLADATGAAQ